MNDDLEREFADAPRTGLPETLDRGVESLIGRSEAGSLHRGVPLWAAAAACILCIVLGFLAGNLTLADGDRPAVIYIEERPESLPAALGGDGNRETTGFFQQSRGEVTALPRG